MNNHSLSRPTVPRQENSQPSPQSADKAFVSLFVQSSLPTPFMASTLTTGDDYRFVTLRPGEQQYLVAIKAIQDLSTSGTMARVGSLIPLAQSLRAALLGMDMNRAQLAPLDAILNTLTEEAARDVAAETPLATFLLGLRHAGLYPDETEAARAAALRLRRLASGVPLSPTRPMLAATRTARGRFIDWLGDLLLRWGASLRGRTPTTQLDTVHTIDEGTLGTFSAVDPSLVSRTDTDSGRLLVKRDIFLGASTVEGIALSDYVLEREIGRGGMGFVFQARDTGTNRRVAIKIISPENLLLRRRFRDRFDNERRLHGAAESGRIVRVYATGVTALGEPFMVMELIPGGDLGKRLESEGGSLDLSERLRLCEEATAAVVEAHEHRIVHRDIKPDNFFLTRDGQLKLSDFGIAMRESEVERTLREEAGNTAGTPGYMDFQTWCGQNKGYRSDVFALGVTLYQILTGRLPWIPVGTNYPVHALAVAHEAALLPSELMPGIPTELDRIVMKAIAADPDLRYPNARAFHLDLITMRARSLEHEAEAIRLPSWPEKPRRDELDRWRTLMKDALTAYTQAFERFAYPEISAKLVSLNWVLYQRAELEGHQGEMDRAAATIVAHDPEGQPAQVVGGRIATTVQIQPIEEDVPGGKVKIGVGRFIDRGGILQWEYIGPLSPDALQKPLTYPRGPVYALRVEREGFYPITVPLPVRPSEATRPHTIRIPLYPTDMVPKGFLVIPAGPVAIKTGLGRYSERVETWRLVTHDYAIGPKVTNQDYIRYLRRLHGAGRELDNFLPRHWDLDLQMALKRGNKITVSQLKDRSGRTLHPRAAVTGLSYEQGLAYLHAVYGKEARYPTLSEWKRAVRGNDARTFPWGDAIATQEMNVNWRVPGHFDPSEVYPNDTETADVSPFSLRGLQGLEAGLRLLVSGTYIFITITQASLLFPAAGLHHVNVADPRAVAEWSLLVGKPHTAAVQASIEELTPDPRAGPQLLELTGIIPVIPLRAVDPTPDIQTLGAESLT